MSETRTVEMGWAGACFAFAVLATLWCIGIDLTRIAYAQASSANTQVLLLCIEAAKVGIDMKTLPEPCKGLKK